MLEPPFSRTEEILLLELLLILVFLSITDAPFSGNSTLLGALESLVNLGVECLVLSLCSSFFSSVLFLILAKLLELFLRILFGGSVAEVTGRLFSEILLSLISFGSGDFIFSRKFPVFIFLELDGREEVVDAFEVADLDLMLELIGVFFFWSL